jgi:hypothetical protein
MTVFSEGPHQSEREPGFKDLTIITTTRYGNDHTSNVRMKLALRLFDNAQKLGVRCVVVDSSTNEAFLERARAYSCVTLISEEPGSTMGAGRRQGIRHALQVASASGPGPHYCLWTEPEKAELITADNLSAMLAPLRTGRANIVVPKRTQSGMNSLPAYQARTEQAANERIAGISGSNETWDVMFGPKAFDTDAAAYFLDYPDHLVQTDGTSDPVDLWDAIIVPVALAHKGGKTVQSVEVAYKYDQSQRADEEGNVSFDIKRERQYAAVLAALTHAIERRSNLQWWYMQLKHVVKKPNGMGN